MLMLEVIDYDFFAEILPTFFALNILISVDIQVLLLIWNLIESEFALCDWAMERPLTSMNS
jgi:hypothetical protein